MKRYDWILFDLDGTLTDPGEGITNSVAYALRKFGITVNDRTELYRFIGPPLYDSFEKFYGFTHEEARQAIVYYREYYTEHGILENRLYEGVDAMLTQLVDAGKKVCLATSKPEVFAKKILEHFGLSAYFTFIGGALLDETRTKKDEVIGYVLDSCGITDSSSVLMVGDREHDVLGAKVFDIDTLGVLFGYGDREELTTAGAVYLAETVEDMTKQILA